MLTKIQSGTFFPKTALPLLLGLLFYQGVCTQKTMTDPELATVFKTFYDNAYKIDSDPSTKGDIRDSIKQLLIRSLMADKNMSTRWDSLSEQVNVQKSDDGRLQFFSWDERSGGSMHDMALLVQFRDDNGQVHAQALDPDHSDDSRGPATDACFSILYEFPGDNGVLYILKGWGTYGGGTHHESVRAFQIKGSKLEPCKNCFGNKDYLEVICQRMQKPDIHIDLFERTIRHRSYDFDDDLGYYKARGTQTIWKFDGKVFQPTEAPLDPDMEQNSDPNVKRSVPHRN